MRPLVPSIIAAACMMIAGSVIAIEMPAIAKKNHCTDCHSIDRKIVGPSWMDISTRYKGATEYEFRGNKYPLEDGLVMKVSKGGSGNWGHMPMPNNDPSGTLQPDIRELVKFVLSLAK